MKSFKEVLKEALSYKEVKTSAIVAGAGCVAAIIVPFVVKNTSIQTALLMGLCLTVAMFSERVSVVIRLIREQDLEANGQKVYKDS